MPKNSISNNNDTKNQTSNLSESWTTLECENLNDDFDFLIKKISEVKLSAPNSVLSIKIITANDTKELCPINLKKFQQKFKNKSTVIFVAAKNDQKFLIYWKSKDIRQVLFLSSYKEHFSEDDKDVCEFAAEFLVASLGNNHLGIQTDHDISSLKGTTELDSLVDSRNYNLLLLAAESGNSKPIKSLLQYGIESQIPKNNVTAQSLAYNARHFDVLLELLNENLPFPMQFEISECSEEIKRFIEISEEFHELIKDGNKEGIEEMLEKHSNLRYFYNLLNESALKMALELDIMDIYELLVSKDLCFGPHEDVDGIFNDMKLEKMEEVQKIHDKHHKDIPERHLNILMANTFIIQDDPNETQNKQQIHQIYTKFNKNPQLKIILKAVAVTKTFKIVFNFCHSSSLEPPASPRSSLNSHRLDIPAKQLLDPSTEHKVYGTSAHELCHYALHAVYGNKANPYTKLDREAEKRFQKIITACKVNKDSEKSIKSVYDNYEKTEQPSELIVRPAHLIAMYIDQPEKLKEAAANFPELFEYFEEVIAKMEGAVVEIYGKFKFVQSFEFSRLSESSKFKVESGFVNFKGTKVKLSELFPENSAIFELLTSEHILKLLKNKLLDFSDPHFGYIKELIEFKWESLAETLKDIFLNSVVSFQGQKIKFERIFELYPEAFSVMTSEEIKDVLNGDEMVIKGEIRSENDSKSHGNCFNFYVDRKFIPEDVKLIYLEYESKIEDSRAEVCQEESLESSKKVNIFQEFYENFLEQNFDDYQKNLAKIKENSNFKSQDCNLNDEKYQFLCKNASQILEQVETDRILILSSETGTGKSTIFKQFLTEVKNKCPTKWVAKIDVVDFIKFVDNSEEFKAFWEFLGSKDIKFEKLNQNINENLENNSKSSENQEINSNKNNRIFTNSESVWELLENLDENSANSVTGLEKLGKNSVNLLKNYEEMSENFQKLGNYLEKFNKKPQNLRIITQFLEIFYKLKSIPSKFESKILQESLTSGNVIFFWDQIDQISSNSTKNFLNLVKLIHQNTSNIQFISSNLSNSAKLRQSLKLRPWQLLPFDEDNKREFLTKNFISQAIFKDKAEKLALNIENNSSTTPKDKTEESIPDLVKFPILEYFFNNISNSALSKVEENVTKVEKLMTNFNSNDFFVYDFDTPIMLQLLSKTDNQGNVLDYSQIYSIFDSFLKDKVKTYLQSRAEKLTEAEKSEIANSIRATFQQQALLQEFPIFCSTTLGLKLKKLQIFQKHLQNLDLNFLKLLIPNGKNKFKFLHKLFSEFFVAQFFLENVLNVSGYVDINEAELRLELFFHLMQNYGNLQQVITDFMSSYLTIKGKTKKKFNPTISILLRTKFKNFFIRLLDTNHPKVFGFLFEFFKSDHSLLVDLLHVYEDETLYTAVFNPNYFGVFVDPTEIRELGKSCLTEEEFENFVNGKNQQGKILFGVHFYGLLGVMKAHEAYDTKFEDTSLVQWHNIGSKAPPEALSTQNSSDQQSEAFMDSYQDLQPTPMSTAYWKFLQKCLKPQTFIQKLFQNPQDDQLTENDQKQLFMTAISPKIYLFYDKLFSTADFAEYKKLWANFENLLSKFELQEAIGTALMSYFEICPDNKDGHDRSLYLLLKKAKKFLTTSQIYEIFMSKNIFHEAFWDSGNFKILWNFLSERTSKDERKQLLLQDDLGDQNFYFFSLLNEAKDKFSSHKFVYYFYDFTELKIIHRAMTTGNAPAFEFVTEIYEKYLSKTEIQEVILNANDFLLYLIGKSNEKSCEEFLNYLEKLFEGSEHLLVEFLDRKVQPTNLTIFKFVKDFKELEGSKLKWFKNLEILKNLYDKIKINKI